MPPERPVPGSAGEWLVYARRDLAMAQAPLPEGAVYEQLCFHAQQAAEKAIKAVYRARGQTFRYTHDLDDLLYGLERNGMVIPESIWDAADLTRFAWESRYPGFGEPVTETEYQQALTLARRVVAWAEALIEAETAG